MSSFEWTELPTLTTDIAASRSRLSAARLSKNRGLVRTLEEEIAAAEARRAQLLANIPTDVAGTDEPAADPGATGATEDISSPNAPVAVEEASQNEADEAEVSVELVHRIHKSAEALPAPAPKGDGVEGGNIVWEQLTPSDIERATRELNTRREETLARHTEELMSFEADQSQLHTLEQAINAFMLKFKQSSVESVVVMLEDGREQRQQFGG
jgi:hypothetical protein